VVMSDTPTSEAAEKNSYSKGGIGWYMDQVLRERTSLEWDSRLRICEDIFYKTQITRRLSAKDAEIQRLTKQLKELRMVADDSDMTLHAAKKEIQRLTERVAELESGHHE